MGALIRGYFQLIPVCADLCRGLEHRGFWYSQGVPGTLEPVPCGYLGHQAFEEWRPECPIARSSHLLHSVPFYGSHVSLFLLVTQFLFLPELFTIVKSTVTHPCIYFT